MNLTQKEEMSEIKKSCVDCKTTRTPLWRSGPAGPKSLCNACGIRYRKKRSEREKKKEKSATSTTNTNISAAAAAGTTTTTTTTKTSGGGSSGKVGKLGEVLRARLIAFGKEVVMLQRQRTPMKRQRTSRKMGEEEQAAVLLMSLSCGSVFA